MYSAENEAGKGFCLQEPIKTITDVELRINNDTYFSKYYYLVGAKRIAVFV